MVRSAASALCWEGRIRNGVDSAEQSTRPVPTDRDEGEFTVASGRGERHGAGGGEAARPARHNKGVLGDGGGGGGDDERK